MDESEYVALSDSDVERIETDLYPKAKQSVLWISAGLLGLCLVLPFVPGRLGSRSALESMGYPGAFFFFFLIFACFVLYGYQKSVRGLRDDLNDGRKYVFRTRVLRKVWKGQNQFELFLEKLPKALSKRSFVYAVSESHLFHEGDVVVLEYLGRSGVLLKVFAVV